MAFNNLGNYGTNLYQVLGVELTKNENLYLNMICLLSRKG